MDLYRFDPNLSTVNKVQREYWMAKQVLKKKFGKGEDQHVIAGDNDIDSKLAQYESIQGTCLRLLKELETYHSCICGLARDENQLGRFLKDQGGQDPTQAGKMMIAVGKALCQSAQLRLHLRHPLGRLREDVETFRQRAIADTNLSVKKMEEERTHYRASLLWMQDISASLDPEQYRKLEKYRKVQNEVRMNKEKFDRLKWAVCQKIDLLSASRSNLFSNTLVPYQDELLNFWDKTARNMAAVLESFDGYQQYEFKLLKDLNPIQLGDPLADQEGEAEKEDSNDNALINLDSQEDDDNKNEVDESPFEDGMDALDLREPAETPSKTNESPTDTDLLGDFSETSKEEQDLWNDLLSNNEHDTKGEFANQWKSAFGDFVSAVPQEEEKSIGQLEKDLLDPLKPAEKPPQQNSGFLPSQLLDMHFQQNMGPMIGQMPIQPPSYNSIQPMGLNQQQAMFMQQQGMMIGRPQGQVSLPPGMPFNASTMLQQQGQSAALSGQRPASKSGSKGQSDWYNLFAELDPLQNPDALGKKEAEKGNEDGRAC